MLLSTCSLEVFEELFWSEASLHNFFFSRPLMLKALKHRRIISIFNLITPRSFHRRLSSTAEPFFSSSHIMLSVVWDSFLDANMLGVDRKVLSRLKSLILFMIRWLESFDYGCLTCVYRNSCYCVKLISISLIIQLDKWLITTDRNLLHQPNYI